MTPERAPSPATSNALTVVVHAPGGVSMALPPIVADAGEAAARFTLEFFASRIPNTNTRKAYGRAVFRFCAWCQAQGVGLRALAPPTLSAYLEGLRVSPASVKLTASALRYWLDYLLAARSRRSRSVIRAGWRRRRSTPGPRSASSDDAIVTDGGSPRRCGTACAWHERRDRRFAALR
jgi:hypothetical protein